MLQEYGRLMAPIVVPGELSKIMNRIIFFDSTAKREITLVKTEII
jgi:hypothetical protein